MQTGTPVDAFGRGNKLDSGWHDSALTRSEFMTTQLTPLMRALVITGTAGFAMFVAGVEWLGGSPIPLFPKLVVLGLLVLLSLATLPASASRYLTQAGWLCIALLQVGILLTGLFRADAVSWLLPGFMVVILVSSPSWLNTRDFAIAMLLSMTGPVVAWWLLRPGVTVAVQLALFATITLGSASVIHIFIQWQLNAQLRLQTRLSKIACTDTLTGITKRMRVAVASLDLSCGVLSISAGAAMLRRDDQSVNGLLAAADHALRRAKRNGRDRVEVAHVYNPYPAPELHVVGDSLGDS